MHKYMNKYEQLYEQLYMTKCVYNGVYEGNIPVSMIHLYTRGLGTHIRGKVHLSLFKSYVNRYSQRGLGLIPTWRPMVYFWEDLKKTFIFDLLFKVKKKTNLIDDMYKNAYNEIPNFMYWNGTYTYVEARVLFYKTWLIVLLTDAKFEKLFLKVCFERSFLYKEKLYKKGKGLILSNIREAHVLFS